MTPGKRDLTELSDPQLAAALAAGEVDGMDALYRRYGGDAYSLAIRILGDQGRAEDAVQEAFVRVWKRIGSFAPDRGSLRTWLLTIVRNCAIDNLRGSGREREELELQVEVRAEGEGSNPWREVSRALERQAVQDALGALPREQRQAIELAYYGGYTQQEIARMVSVPLGTVKGRTRLALEKLCSYLQGRGLIDGD
jgi:RNA polymerase sigma-70 factor (ECF subfamily)